MRKNRTRKSHGITGVSLRLGILAGLLGLAAFLYAVFYLSAPFWGERDYGARFQKALREYDALFAASISVGKSSLRDRAPLERKLVSIEKLNGKPAFATLQTTLSLLKRERVFSRYDAHFRKRYEQNLLAAAQKYPQTVQLEALALEDALKNGLPAIADALKMNEGRGRFAETMISALAQSFDSANDSNNDNAGADGKREHLLVDAALLSVVVAGGAYRDTNAVLYPLDAREAESVNTRRFAAEYAYDAGDFPLAARLFAALPDDNALQRAGDALFLGGDTDGARELWLLSSNVSPDVSSNANSLYNYASLSEDAAEQMTALEKLLAPDSDSDPNAAAFSPPSSPGAPFSASLVLYTRLLNDERAAATLGTSLRTERTPLLDLELWRRTEKNYAPSRALAEMWLLIGRHPRDPQAYEYAAWFFARERQYEELALLLKNAALQGVASRMLRYWHIMLDAQQTGDNKQCREALSALYNEHEEYEQDAPWYIAANMGRLYEAERSWKNAADAYYAALSASAGARDKSRILQRIAVCLAVQGRNTEARGALEEAVFLDPANLNARAALNRQ
jgi:tetratricopeptide (TPR) repeat protein